MPGRAAWLRALQAPSGRKPEAAQAASFRAQSGFGEAPPPLHILPSPTLSPLLSCGPERGGWSEIHLQSPSPASRGRGRMLPREAGVEGPAQQVWLASAQRWGFCTDSSVQSKPGRPSGGSGGPVHQRLEIQPFRNGFWPAGIGPRLKGH